MGAFSDRMDCPDASAFDEAFAARRDLRGIAAQLSQIAAHLHDNAYQQNSVSDQIHAPPQAEQPDRRTFLRLARTADWLRRQRAAIFGCPEMFGEPAWDILLDLYIAYAEGKQVSVSSACIGSACPPTTGLRWLSVLTEQGLVIRENDSNDNRRVMVRLADKGVAAMEQFLTTVAS